MMTLIDKEIEIIMIRMFRTLIEKIDKMHKQKDWALGSNCSQISFDEWKFVLLSSSL